jgi:hypothetical protein
MVYTGKPSRGCGMCKSRRIKVCYMHTHDGDALLHTRSINDRLWHSRLTTSVRRETTNMWELQEVWT